MRRGNCRRRRGLSMAPAPRRPACVHRSASAARAQRERSASAARAQRASARARQHPKAAERGAAVAAAAAPQLAGRRHAHGPSPLRPRRHAACGKSAWGPGGGGYNGGRRWGKPSMRGGTRQEGGKEANPRAGRSRGAAQRPPASPCNGACDKPPAPPARWPSRARTIQPERAQPERASGRTWQWGSLSLVQRGAPRCTDAPNPAATRARLSRAAHRLVRNPQRPTRPASHPRPRPSSRASLRARVRMRNAACAMARHAVSAHPHGPSASHARMARCEGGSEGHSSPHPTTPRRCTRACRCRMSGRQKRPSPTRVM